MQNQGFLKSAIQYISSPSRFWLYSGLSLKEQNNISMKRIQNLAAMSALDILPHRRTIL